MFHAVHQDRRKPTTIPWTAASRIVIVLTVLCGCLNEQAIGDDVTARQRFVVEVSCMVRMNATPTHTISEVSRVEISTGTEVVLALSSVEESASSSDVVFLLHSGQRCYLSIHRGSGSPESSGARMMQTVSLSGLPCLEYAAESTPVLTISSI